MYGIIFPNSYITCCGTSALLDALLTDWSLLLLTFNAYEKSRIMQNSLDMCGIAAMGEFFRFGGGLYLIEFYGTQRQSPSATHSRVSAQRAIIAFSTRADAYGTLSTATCISVTAQSCT